MSNLGSGEFDPEASVLDYMTWEAVSYAIKNGLTPPFRLIFADANQSLFRESVVRIRKDKISEQIVSEDSGNVPFPLSCRLTDSKGRRHEMVVSDEEIKSWMDSTGGCSHYIRFPAKIPNDSPEVFLTVRQMLMASCLKGFEPPFTVEIRDASGELFDTAQIYADEEGEFRGGRHLCNCAHARFPVTIKLISQSGAELTATVQRHC
jgi:hypothetical protein